MGIEYYGFVAFVFLLICLLALLCNHLFSDVRRQKKLLDEKESKILRLYQSLEDSMDEFNDSVAANQKELEAHKEELKLQKQELYAYMKSLRTSTSSREPEPSAVTAPNLRTALPKQEEVKEAKEPGETPKRTARTKKSSGAEGEKEPSPKKERAKSSLSPNVAFDPKINQRVMDLQAEGRNRNQIAQELKITLSEVDLVIGLSNLQKKN